MLFLRLRGWEISDMALFENWVAVFGSTFAILLRQRLRRNQLWRTGSGAQQSSATKTGFLVHKQAYSLYLPLICRKIVRQAHYEGRKKVERFFIFFLAMEAVI